MHSHLEPSNNIDIASKTSTSMVKKLVEQSMLKNALITALLMLFYETTYAKDVLCKKIGDDWVWFSDHIALYVTYQVIAKGDRRYQVGTGVSVSGVPRGKKKTYSGKSTFDAYLLGALHIRKSDDGEDFSVCATASDIGLVPLTSILENFINNLEQQDNQTGVK